MAQANENRQKDFYYDDNRETFDNKSNINVNEDNINNINYIGFKSDLVSNFEDPYNSRKSLSDHNALIYHIYEGDLDAQKRLITWNVAQYGNQKHENPGSEPTYNHKFIISTDSNIYKFG